MRVVHVDLTVLGYCGATPNNLLIKMKETITPLTLVGHGKNSTNPGYPFFSPNILPLPWPVHIFSWIFLRFALLNWRAPCLQEE
jgi:hypothetical protein